VEWIKHGGGATSITRADDIAFDGQAGFYVSGFTQGASFDALPSPTRRILVWTFEGKRGMWGCGRL
jgi:hypothetical protein